MEYKKQLHVLVQDHDNVLFKDWAQSVSSVNELGPFDVLPLHSNFISLIQKNVSIHKIDGNHKQIVIEYALMRVYENTVMIFLGLGLEV